MLFCSHIEIDLFLVGFCIRPRFVPNVKSNDML